MSTTVTHRYVHRDHLGSITAITDESTGAVVERLSYDAWGQRRNATTWAAGAVIASEHRGYTGHEHLDDVGVIHMNGRIYSPILGRIMSPDPVTQAPENGQNYDRYSYAFNNPLRYSDPSGFVSCDSGELGSRDTCGNLLAPFMGFNGSNETAGYDSLDGLLDYHFGDFDHLIGEGGSSYSSNFSNGLDSGGHAVVAPGDQTLDGAAIDTGLAAAYSQLREDVIARALTTDGPIELAESELYIIYEYMVAEAMTQTSGLPVYARGNNESIVGNFGTFDTFLRDLGGRDLLIGGGDSRFRSRKLHRSWHPRCPQRRWLGYSSACCRLERFTGCWVQWRKWVGPPKL